MLTCDKEAVMVASLSHKTKIICIFATMISFNVQGNDMPEVTPPLAPKEVVTFHEFGHTRIDPYHWLNQRDNPQVLSYLQAENAYTDSKMQATKELQKKLFNEIKGRIKQDDNSVPVKEGHYFYYMRFENNKNYPIYCRKKDNLNNPEEIILDVNELAKSHPYYDLADFKISPSENLIVFAEDTQGRRIYNLKIKDLNTGQYLPDILTDNTANFEWANDSKTLFYTKQDPVTLRSDRIYRHQLGQDQNKDKLVYQEKDDTYNTEILKTKSKQYLMIRSSKTDSDEFQILEANHPEGAFRLFTPRQKDHEYDVEHHGDKFLIRTNKDALNFKLMQCDINKTALEEWQPLIPYQKDIYLEDVEVFDKFFALQQRDKGLVEIKIYPFNDIKKPYNIPMEEADYSAYIGQNLEFSSNQIRFVFNSLKTPKSVYDFDMQTKNKVLKKKNEVLGNFNSKDYDSQRIYAKAQDGVMIPISLVYRKDKFKPHSNPLLLAGYGSYGINYDPDFSYNIISLLDRGFVFAIAHIRGGSELGRQWYYDGRLLKKKNTFTDFIAAADHLDKSGFAAKDKIYATGASAGGLLLGAVINMRPDRFKGIVTHVPFVDMMNTMLDPDIPLTTGEYGEWGNPKEKIYYDYMLSYSPYDNIQKMNYPHILTVASYNDSQVQYWEPAKWVAKLRDYKTDQHLLLLQTLMDASHSGVSSRDGGYQQTAFEYAFLLNLEGQNE